MEIWRRNLYVLCGSLFFVMVAMSMIMPFLPLYIQQDFGIEDPHQVTAWAGIIFGANFLTAGLVSPIWGNLADKHGRKIMILRSGFFMSITMALTGFAGSLWQLLALRLLNGLVGGIIPASTALVASSVPKERIGYATGLLQSFITAGTIMGPLFGGVLAEKIGFRMIFVITGCVLLLATLVITFTVKENFVPPEKKERSSLREDFQMIFSSKELPALFFVTVMIQFALFSIIPVLPIYISQLLGSEGAKVALWAGIVQSMYGRSQRLCLATARASRRSVWFAKGALVLAFGCRNHLYSTRSRTYGMAIGRASVFIRLVAGRIASIRQCFAAPSNTGTYGQSRLWL